MFFRRQRPKEVTFQDRLEALRSAGFAVESVGNGRVRVSREGVAAVLEDVRDGPPRIVERAGLLTGEAIAALVDGGFQKFFETHAGIRIPALASHLKAVHDFQEDLGEAVGLISLYN